MSSHYSAHSKDSRVSRFSRRKRLGLKTPEQDFAEQLEKLKSTNNFSETASNKLLGMNVKIDDADSYDSDIENSHYGPEEDKEDKEAVADIIVSKEFKEYVIRYVKLDDLVKQRQSEIKELTELRRPCEEYILKYLDANDSGTIEISNGKLIKNKMEQKGPLKPDTIKTALEKKITDPKIVGEIMNLMEELRPKQTKVNLKRTSVKTGSIKKKKIEK